MSTCDAPTKEVIAERESTIPIPGTRTFDGFTVTVERGDHPDRYRMVHHLRTFDGIRVVSRHDSSAVDLHAATADEAIRAAVKTLAAYRKTLAGE